jgi:hypothetical protein
MGGGFRKPDAAGSPSAQGTDARRRGRRAHRDNRYCALAYAGRRARGDGISRSQRRDADRFQLGYDLARKISRRNPRRRLGFLSRAPAAACRGGRARRQAGRRRSGARRDFHPQYVLVSQTPGWRILRLRQHYRDTPRRRIMLRRYRPARAVAVRREDLDHRLGRGAGLRARRRRQLEHGVHRSIYPRRGPLVVRGPRRGSD